MGARMRRAAYYDFPNLTIPSRLTVRIPDNVKGIAAVADTHCGCKHGLNPTEVELETGSRYIPHKTGLELHKFWDFCWWEWLPHVLGVEALEQAHFDLVHVGDLVDGKKHPEYLISTEIADQLTSAYELMRPLVEVARRAYFVRGTPAHDGRAGQYMESVASRLEIPRAKHSGTRSHKCVTLLWRKHRIQFYHSMGTGEYGMRAMEKEAKVAWEVAGRWGEPAPDVIIRAHRHDYSGVWTQAANGQTFYGVSCPCWKLPNDWLHDKHVKKQLMPVFGMLCITENKFGRVVIEHMTKPLS